MARHALGLGASSGASAAEVRALVDEVLAEAGVGRAAVDCVGTILGLAADPRLTALGWPVVGFDAAALARVPVPTSGGDRALGAVGTPSVAEAAALLAAGGGDPRAAAVVVPKRRSERATAALAATASSPPAASEG